MYSEEENSFEPNRQHPLANQVLTVCEVVGLLKDLLAHSVPNLQFQGELGPISRASSGHVYFTIKDANSKTPHLLNGVMWKGVASSLSFRPEEGLLVECKGTPTIYPASGRLQIVVTSMQPAGGEGALRIKFEQLKARLTAEGLFLSERKRPLPRFPAVVGVVTSITGSVIHDIAVTVSARMPSTQIIVAHAKVQGDGSVDEIVKAIRRLNEEPTVEVIIVARGGGSLEDLWSFNEEAVVRAIFASKKPVISAVGHETDTTLADFVADFRAPTPTGAARIVVPDVKELEDKINSLRARLSGVHSLISNFEQRLDSAEAAFGFLAERIIESNKLKLTNLRLMLDRGRPDLLLLRSKSKIDQLLRELQTKLLDRITVFKNQIELHNSRLAPNLASRANLAANRLQSLSSKMDCAIINRFQSYQANLASTEALLKAYDPKLVLKRGFAIVSVDQKVALSALDIKPDDNITVKLKDGLVLGKVLEIKLNNAS